MKRLHLALTLSSLLIAAAVIAAPADHWNCCRRGPRCANHAEQSWRGPRHGRCEQPIRHNAQRIYDAATVETIQGEVVAVERVAGRGRRGSGVHLEVKTASGTLPVHLGPEWFLKDQPLQVKTGDRVSVTGSKVDFRGESAVIATEVARDGDVLKLRNAEGDPVWAGPHRRRVD